MSNTEEANNGMIKTGQVAEPFISGAQEAWEVVSKPNCIKIRNI